MIQAIIERRKAAGITQEQAANLIGMSPKTYQRIENGETDMRLGHYLNLIEKLNASNLDIALDCIGVTEATPYDVAAAARTLPAEARAALITMIMIIDRQNNGH